MVEALLAVEGREIRKLEELLASQILTFYPIAMLSLS